MLVEVKAQSSESESKGVRVLYPFLDSVVESTETLRLLVKQKLLRDSYVIARVIYESSVNACFLLTEPKKLSARMYTHANQKALRSLVRTLELSGEKLFEFKPNGVDKFLEHPTHQEWLKEFTSKSGKEITSWTPENVKERVEAVFLKFGHEPTRGLAFGLLMYRHASEIAHGTLYGTLFSWGAMEIQEPLTSENDIAVFRTKELRHLLKLVCYSLESLIRISGETLTHPAAAVSAKEARLEYYRLREADV